MIALEVSAALLAILHFIFCAIYPVKEESISFAGFVAAASIYLLSIANILLLLAVQSIEETKILGFNPKITLLNHIVCPVGCCCAISANC